jgi:hypothetical protein
MGITSVVWTVCQSLSRQEYIERFNWCMHNFGENWKCNDLSRFHFSPNGIIVFDYEWMFYSKEDYVFFILIWK